MTAAGAAGNGAARLSWFARLWRRPVLVFISVTLLVSYSLGFPGLMAASAWAPALGDVAPLYLGRFFVVIGPTCGAFVALAAASNRSAIGPFLRRRLSLPPRQWLFALLLPPAGLALVFASYAGAGLSLPTLATAMREAWPLLLAHFSLQILIVGLGEELGWRGWLLPALTERHGLFHATLLTGIVWYFWHLPLLLGGVGDAVWFAVGIGGLSLLYSTIWVLSGRSAALPAIAHGSVNAPIIYLTAQLSAADHAAAWRFLCGALAAVGLVALLATRACWHKPDVSSVDLPA